jgi:hypothetical protein
MISILTKEYEDVTLQILHTFVEWSAVKGYKIALVALSLIGLYLILFAICVAICLQAVDSFGFEPVAVVLLLSILFFVTTE